MLVIMLRSIYVEALSEADEGLEQHYAHTSTHTGLNIHIHTHNTNEGNG